MCEWETPESKTLTGLGRGTLILWIVDNMGEMSLNVTDGPVYIFSFGNILNN